MTGRILTWTGNGGDLYFDTPGNWDNWAGNTAKYAPDRADTVILSGMGTIAGDGAVGTIDVTGEFSLAQEGSTIIADTVNDTGVLQLDGESLRTRSLNIVGDQAAAYLVVSLGSTLSAAGAALDITVNTAEIGNSVGLAIDDGEVALGAGTLTLGSESGGSIGGVLDIEGGTLSGDRFAAIDLGVNGGTAQGFLATGTIAIGGSLNIGMGNFSVGYFSTQGGTISAGSLDVGLGGDGQVNLNGTNLDLSGISGVGLAIASGNVHGGQGTVTATGDMMTVAGRTEIGVTGLGLFEVENATTLTTNGGVDIGSGDFGGIFDEGALLIDPGAVWHDIGGVRVANGTLSVVNQGTNTITGNLGIGAGTYSLFSASVLITQATLDVTGTLDIHAAQYGNQADTLTLQNGAFLNAGALTMGSGNNNIAIDGTGSGEPQTTLAVGSFVSLGGTIFAQDSAILTIGTSQDKRAALIGGRFVLGSATMTVTGSTVVTGDLDVLNGAMSVSALGAALTCDGGLIYVQGPSGVLDATGGVTIENGGTIILNSTGLLIASAGSGSDALMIGNGSTLDDQSIVDLVGNSTITGTLAMYNGVLNDTGIVTLANGGMLSGYGTIAANVRLQGTSYNVGVTTINGNVSGSGTLDVGRLTLLGSVADTTTLGFAKGGQIIIGHADEFNPTMTGWAANDSIELLNVSATSDSISGQTLTLYDSGDHVVASLRFAGSINANDFALQQSQGNTTITHPG